MGCVNPTFYNNKKFDPIKWYIERIDKRLGEIVIIQKGKYDSFICKKIDKKRKVFIEKQRVQFHKAFLRLPEFLLGIRGYKDTLDVVQCESKEVKKKEDHIWVKIDCFDKDLNDDINLRSLKQRSFSCEEIWNLIYFSIFVFSLLEEADIEIKPIRRSNFLISNKKFKYYCENLFYGNQKEKEQSNNNTEDNQFRQAPSFEDKRLELLLMLLFTINLLHNIKEIKEYEEMSRNTLFTYLFTTAENHVDVKLYSFLYDVLYQNQLQVKSFIELREYLIEIYETFEIRFFDKSYVKAFQIRETDINPLI